MTSPAITKSPNNQKSDKKSPTHSAGGGGEERPVSRTASVTGASTSAVTPHPPESFSWMRIFKLADLMMKQGC